jgi:hypothetical protein
MAEEDLQGKYLQEITRGEIFKNLFIIPTFTPILSNINFRSEYKYTTNKFREKIHNNQNIKKDNKPKLKLSYSNIKTKIRNLTALKTSLTNLGIDWKEGPRAVRGYQGQTVTAEVVVEQANNYDIGFSWNGQEYELVADLQYWQQPLTVDGFLKQVTKGYALETILQESAKQGFQVAEQTNNQDGSIRLVVQRWSA